MGKKRNIPIRRKLTLIILVTCAAALLAGGAVHFLFQVINFRESFSQDVAALAQILARNSTAAIAFQDNDTANEVLAALGTTPHIVSARLETPDGAKFASFGKAETFDKWRNRPIPTSNTGIFDSNFLIHRQPVILDGEQVGTLFLKSDYGQVWQSILRVNAGILGTALAISLLVAYLVSSRLQRIISGPVHDLAETARNIAENHDYSLRATKHGEDEIGAFTDAFNLMLDRIQTQDATLRHEIEERERAEKSLTDAQNRLVEASRAAGMAEVATGVLHNVGNVLNSVNVSTTLIGTRLRDSRAQNVGRLAELLLANQEQLAKFLSEDERGRQLPKYLSDLSQHLASERELLLNEVLSLEKNVGHIKDIVAVQQTHARRHGIIEAHSAQKLVEDAIQMSAANLNRHEIKLIRGFSEARLVAVDKHKVLQILINLLQNALHAVENLPPNKRVVTIGIKDDGAQSVRVTVTDCGVGIAPENLTRIFSHGFTTRQEGHGFGLHSGAIAAREMGGSLSASSQGPNLGATFTLELPVAPPPNFNSAPPTSGTAPRAASKKNT